MKIKTHKSEKKTLKHSQKLAFKFGRTSKNAYHTVGFIKKFISSGIGGELFSISYLPITSLKLPSISHPNSIFSINYGRNRLLLERFVDLPV